MRALTRIAAGIVLAIGISGTAEAAVYNLGFPIPNDPAGGTKTLNHCAASGPGVCRDQGRFSLSSPLSVDILFKTLDGSFESNAWRLYYSPPPNPPITPTVLTGGFNTSISGERVLTQIIGLTLQPGLYSFNVVFRLGSGTYLFDIRSHDVAGVPIPAAGLLFLSGLGALGFSSRKYRKPAPQPPEA